MQVVWTDAAQDDVLHHTSYIAQFNPYAAAGLFHRLQGAGNGLALYPRRGRPGPHGTRELTLVQPYVLVYEVDDGAGKIVILRIWHGAQDRAASGREDPVE